MVDKISNPLAAANAYSTTAKSAIPGAAGGESGGLSFGDMLESAARNAIDTIRGGEQASARAVTGKADLVEVTQAVTQARLALDTVVAVRDQMVDAYNRIIQMPI
jgi:flagellar hook-basal body complex protein FliE